MIVAKYNLRSANYSRGWVVTCEDGCGGECGIQDAEKEYFTPTVQLCTEVESSKQALEPAVTSIAMSCDYGPLHSSILYTQWRN